MKNLKTIRKHKSTEEGFSLVIATGFGLVIMLIGLTIMGRSMKDSSVSASQKTITRSLAAAESGVTQYLSFINRNPLAANFPDCAPRGADGTCNGTSTTVSWANPSGITTDTATVARILANSEQSWKNVSSDSTKGQYRLISYQPPVSGGTGVLKVEGRVNQGTGGALIDDVSMGKTRLQVNMSVSNIPPVPFPGIWLNDGTGSIKQDFYADGLLSNTNRTVDLYVQPNYLTDRTPQPAPRTSIDMARFLPPQPIPFDNSNLTARLTAATGSVTLPVTTGGNTCPTSATPNNDYCTLETIAGVLTKVYRYPSDALNPKNTNEIVVNSVNSAVTSGATIPPTIPQKVIVYLNGDITLSGGGTIKHQCKNTDGSTANICELSNFQIYGYPNPNPTGQIRNIRSGGTFVLEGFIIAPTYTACVTGGGGGGGFKGAVWVKSWNEVSCGGNDSDRLAITQTGTWEQVIPFLPQQPPTIGVISNQAISAN